MFNKWILLVLLACFSACATGGEPPLSAPVEPRNFSLERRDGVWQVHHDSAYYRYFNEIHATYARLMSGITDPAELRRLIMERDLLVARRRREHLADPELVRSVIRATGKNMGANPTGQLFRMNDVDKIPSQSFTPRNPETFRYEPVNPGAGGSRGTDALTAIIQFDRQMKERGIKLIVVPVPNSAQVYAHLLHPDIFLEQVLWHPWAHMLVALLEHDVEVIDLLDLYKTYNGDNTVLNYIDHHWAQAGLEIVGEELAERVKRYSFDKSAYLDRSLFLKRQVTVNAPALIPYWDKIDVSYLAARMPFSPKYRRDQILYKGAPIDKAESHEDSPVLIMGDSFIPHAEETSSGIYAHFAYSTGILPAAYSRDAGAAAPPDFFKQYVAGKGKEPEVVIWQIYGSAMNEITNLNNWHVVSLPPPMAKSERSAEGNKAADPRAATSSSAQNFVSDQHLYLVSGEVIAVSAIPDAAKLDYPDALYAWHLRLDTAAGPDNPAGSTAVVYSRFMSGFVADASAVVKAGDRVRVYLEPWLGATRNTPQIATIQLVDDLGDFENEVFFAHARLQDSSPLPVALTHHPAFVDAETLVCELGAVSVLERLKLHARSIPSPSDIRLETSLDGIHWFSPGRIRLSPGPESTVLVTLDGPHPARLVRLRSRGISLMLQKTQPVELWGKNPASER